MAPRPQAAPRIQIKAWQLTTVLLMLAVTGVLFFFNPAQNGFYPRCMMKATTGLDCPGCGALRSTHQLLNGNFSAAFGLNPLLILLIPVIGVALLNYLLKQQGRTPLYSSRFSRVCLWSLLVVVLAFTILRNLPFPAVAWMSST